MTELRINARMEHAPTLRRFRASDAFVRVAMGPVGSGKSSVCATEIPRRAKRQVPGPDGIRHTRFVVVRNSYRELEDTTRKTFEQWIPAELGTWSEQDFTFHMLFDDVDCEVMFRALDRPDQIKKLLSLEITGAYLNELKEIPKAVFDMIQSRVGRYPSMKDGGPSWRGVWADTNPCDTDHWLFKLFEHGNPEVEYELPDGTKDVVRFELYKQPGGRAANAENIPNLDPGYYQRQLLGKDPDWIKVYIDGEFGFVKEGKPVFPEYVDSLHCQPVEQLRGEQVVFGADFGLTPACVIGQRDPSDGQIQCFREFVSDDMGAVTFGQEVARILRSECVKREAIGWGDPAGKQRAPTDEATTLDVLAAQGLPIAAAPTNDLVPRLEAVKGLLRRLTVRGRPALVIDPKCSVLRKALGGGYCFQRLKVAGEDRFREKPLKNHFSHVADALQYLAVGLGEDRTAISGGQQRKVTLPFTVQRAGSNYRRRG